MLKGILVNLERLTKLSFRTAMLCSNVLFRTQLKSSILGQHGRRVVCQLLITEVCKHITTAFGSTVIQRADGLTVSVTVGGKELLFDEPSVYNSAYLFDNSQWFMNGHLAEALPEGEYDVTITLTDPFTGLSAKKTLHQSS